MHKKLYPVVLLLCAMLSVVGVVQARADAPAFVDDNDTVVLHGNTHHMALSQPDAGLAPTTLPMERMIMSLKMSPAKEKALQEFLRDVKDPASPRYHKWLTPEEFGEKFGPSAGEVATVSHWLASRGFKVEEVGKARTWINFSGDVGKVEDTFKTRIKTYAFGNRLYHANASDPSIPKALSGLVSGVVTLHNIPRQPKHRVAERFPVKEVVPNYTYGSSHYLAPGDFARIYNVKPLWDAGIDGTGQTIAIAGRTNPSAGNWSTFRSSMGLPANPPQVIVNGPNPGDLGADEDTEADLDVEWAGAVAKNATVKFVTSASTYSSDGIDLSVQYIVNNNIAPIMSVSFGSCEANMGSSENAFYNNLWAQAAAQGITVFVSTGDSGAAGCSDPGSATGSGRAVNGLGSTPYNIAVGGTQFNEAGGSYWNSVSSTDMTSVIGYIPEVAWNESGTVGGSGLWATGGGVSQLYGKPSWQVAPGVPQDGMRDVPDVSLSGASHDAYLVYTGGYLSAVGGTSAASPSLASMMALVLQKTGQRQGNANPQFYKLANNQYALGGASIFHDVIGSSNTVPGVTGFTSGAGYDLATGLGSVDAYALVNNWAAPTANPDFSIATSSAVTATAGSTVTVPVQVSVSGGFNSSVSLSVSGLPAGVTGTFTPTALAAPGSGTASLALSVGSTVAAGTRSVTVNATGGGVSRSQSFYLTVNSPADFTLSATTPPSIKQGGAGTVSVSTSALNGFNAPVYLSVSGLPAGVTASFASSSIAAPGTGSSTLTLNVSSSAAAGTSYLTIAATGGGITHSKAVALTVTSAANFSLSATTPAAIKQGSSGTISVSTSALNGFNYPVYLAVSGLPSGVTASFSATSIPAPGTGTSSLRLYVSSTATVGTRYITIAASGGGISHSTVVPLTVSSAADFTLSAGTSSTVTQGSTAAVSVSTAAVNGFNSSVSLSVSGLPAGVTAAFSPASIAAPGSGNSTLTLSASTSASVGTGYLTITATGGGISHSAKVAVTVQTAPALSQGTPVFSSSFSDTWNQAVVYGTGAKWGIVASGTYPSVYPHSGGTMGEFYSYTSPYGSQARFYNPTGVSVPGTATGATLSFWVYHDTGRYVYNDSVQAQLSANGGSTWTSVGSAVSRYNGTTGWSQVNIDVSAYRGQTVLIGFLGTSRLGENMYLDDVTLSVK